MNKKFDSSNKRTWNVIIKHSEPKEVKKFCQNNFKTEVEEFNRCLQPQYFCRLKCDDYVPVEENILNFNCVKDCIKKILSQTNEYKEDKTEWSPKIHEKIDFLPKGEKTYRIGKIDSLKEITLKNKKIKTYFVVYADSAGNNIRAKLTFPTNRIAKCSTKLILRNDCNNVN